MTEDRGEIKIRFTLKQEKRDALSGDAVHVFPVSGWKISLLQISTFFPLAFISAFFFSIFFPLFVFGGIFLGLWILWLRRKLLKFNRAENLEGEYVVIESDPIDKFLKGSVYGKVAYEKIRVADLEKLVSLPAVCHIEAESKARLLVDESIPDTNVPPLWNWTPLNTQGTTSFVNSQEFTVQQTIGAPSTSSLTFPCQVVERHENHVVCCTAAGMWQIMHVKLVAKPAVTVSCSFDQFTQKINQFVAIN